MCDLLHLPLDVDVLLAPHRQTGNHLRQRRRQLPGQCTDASTTGDRGTSCDTRDEVVQGLALFRRRPYLMLQHHVCGEIGKADVACRRGKEDLLGDEADQLAARG